MRERFFGMKYFSFIPPTTPSWILINNQVLLPLFAEGIEVNVAAGILQGGIMRLHVNGMIVCPNSGSDMQDHVYTYA